MMNRTQKRISAIFFFLIALILLLDHLYPGNGAIRLFKLGVLTLLFLISCMIRKKYPEQKLLNLALFFVVLGDALFVLGHIERTYVTGNFKPVMGAAAFAAANTILVYLFSKNFKLGIREILASLPVLGVFSPVFFRYSAFIPHQIFWGVISYCFILCSMTWYGICAVFAGYYTRVASLLLALAGYLIFISDLAVGIAVFAPGYAGHFVPWLENLIWGTFVLGWTIMSVLMAQRHGFYTL